MYSLKTKSLFCITVYFVWFLLECAVYTKYENPETQKYQVRTINVNNRYIINHYVFWDTLY